MNDNLTLGSLFDGSGGFPLGGLLCGITPVWSSEIEPFAVRVTTKRLPKVKHYGDVSTLSGEKLPPVDIITFGSPCQDMSIAGKRAGMKHESRGDEGTTRSGLFYEAVRIIREMREETHGRYPTFAVWENVPGAFSSNGGEDFRCVLEELAKICETGGIQYLDLRAENGNPPERSWATGSALRGGCLTLSIGVSPSAAVESTLWRILEEDAPERYYLSAKACAGVLRRAERRGKTLPKMLREALEEAVALGA